MREEGGSGSEHQIRLDVEAFARGNIAPDLGSAIGTTGSSVQTPTSGAGSGMAKLTEILGALMDLANEQPPNAGQIEQRFARFATARMAAGPNLDRPVWGGSVNSAADVFLALDGDVEGIHAWDDERGWGAWVELTINRGALADVEAVAGRTRPMPRAPDDFHSGEKLTADVLRAGGRLRVFAELTRDQSGVRRVSVSFPARQEPSATPPTTASRDRARNASGGPRRCPKCGTGNARADAFCFSCGMFLDG